MSNNSNTVVDNQNGLDSHYFLWWDSFYSRVVIYVEVGVGNAQ